MALDDVVGGSGEDPPDPNNSAYANSTTKGQIQYLGDVPHARIPQTGEFGMPMGALTQKGYKKGDQVRLLPTGQSLKTLQQSLYAAGYLTDSQMKQIVLGSPDQVTTLAFAKLLATANMSGASWQNALGARLAAAAYEPPQDDRQQLPALTINLTNPEDIKATLQKSARTLLGGYMNDDQANAFVAQFQAQERAQQTQSYYQQYDVRGTDANGRPIGYVGPGGETIAPPDAGVAAENFAKTSDPNQYSATQIGMGVSDAMSRLRDTGYL